MTTNWKDYPEVVDYILVKRQEGYTLEGIAELVRDVHKVDCTRNQVYHILLTYGPDKEVEDAASGQSLVSSRRSQNNSRLANANLRKLSDLVILQSDVIAKIKEAIKDINKNKYLPVDKPKHKLSNQKHKSKMTVELLFSDWQIGKKMTNYDSTIAVSRLREYTETALKEINSKIAQGFDVERIVLVLLGDIIESAEKATGKGSPGSVDCGTPEQMRLSIKHLFVDLIVPLQSLGIKLEVIGVTGNHDQNGPGMIYYNPGREHLSWTIYKTLELIAQECSFTNVSFNIPEGYFATTEYYGQKALYEHGYGLSATEASLNNRRNERMRQLKCYIHYFRMGDKHNICRFNDDSLVVNGAFFGDDNLGSEYSSISGYSGIASQLMFFHLPRKDNRKSIYDSFSIQLHHITK